MHAMGTLAIVALLAAPLGAATPTEINELGWLAGCWRNGDADSSSEECWLAPGGGVMLGMNRSIRKDRTSFEFLRIARDESGRLTYFASPSGKPPTPFVLREATPKRVVFENPEHDFPQRILYWLDDDGVLHGRIEGVEGKQAKGFEWTWARAGSLPTR